MEMDRTVGSPDEEVVQGLAVPHHTDARLGGDEVNGGEPLQQVVLDHRDTPRELSRTARTSPPGHQQTPALGPDDPTLRRLGRAETDFQWTSNVARGCPPNRGRDQSVRPVGSR
ncbi:hypothetical protein GCM10009668_14200 [Nocardioides dubius]|uniref:Uncharacterized protein n=1 Tax=Nocardioides dubius TaxID=317019 RepID=A0ABP4ECQ2_9ACTN